MHSVAVFGVHEKNRHLLLLVDAEEKSENYLAPFEQ
jgi:hypothetical protein